MVWCNTEGEGVVWCNTEGEGRKGEGVRVEGVVWCDGGGRHWWVLTWCPKINDG